MCVVETYIQEIYIKSVLELFDQKGISAFNHNKTISNKVPITSLHTYHIPTPTLPNP